MKRIITILAATVLILPLLLDAQSQPNFSGIWILDAVRSGVQREIWNQRRANRFVIAQTAQEVTIDTGDGSLFGVTEPVVEGPLVYKFDGSPVVVVDRTLGELPGFARKIRTEAVWENSRLVTLTTHFSETSEGASGGVTRKVTFTLEPSGREMTVERTGYRTSKAPPTMLHGRPYRREDDLVYATDTAVYIKAPVR
jgi:hypothetical protein